MMSTHLVDADGHFVGTARSRRVGAGKAPARWFGRLIVQAMIGAFERGGERAGNVGTARSGRPRSATTARWLRVAAGDGFSCSTTCALACLWSSTRSCDTPSAVLTVSEIGFDTRFHASMDWFASMTWNRSGSRSASRGTTRVRRWKSSAASIAVFGMPAPRCDCAGSISSRYVRSAADRSWPTCSGFWVSAAVSSRPPAWVRQRDRGIPVGDDHRAALQEQAESLPRHCARVGRRTTAPPVRGAMSSIDPHPRIPRRATAFCESPRPMRCRPARA